MESTITQNAGIRIQVMPILVMSNMKAKQMWANEYTTWFAGCSPVPGWAKFARPSVPDLYSGPNFIWRVAHCPFLISPAFLALFALGDLSSTSVFFLSIVLMMYYLPPRDEIFGRKFNTIWIFWDTKFFHIFATGKKYFHEITRKRTLSFKPYTPAFWLTKFSTRCIILQFKDTAHQNMILLQQTVHLCQYYKQFSEFSWKPQLQLSHRYRDSKVTSLLVKDFIEYPI